LFGYGTSQLAAWVEEKSAGRIRSEQVQQISLAELDLLQLGDPGASLRRRLAALGGNPLLVVEAERPAQLAAFGALVRELVAAAPPRRFLFQSAASLLNGLVPLPPQPRGRRGLAELRRRGDGGLPLPGLVSIFHRVSGLLLFLAIPFLIYALQLSLADQAGFDAVRSAMTHPLIRLVILALVWAISHHFCAGIRYLFLDLHKGIDLPTARATSWLVFAGSAALTLLILVKLW
jgi:succinate dehydrogenase / fumarate reductase cytochrome b subunit